MTEHIPTDLPTFVPFLIAEDAGGLIGFLQQAFAAEVLMRDDADSGSVSYAKLRIGHAELELSEARDQHPAWAGCFHLFVPDVDAVYARAIEAGADAIDDVRDQPYGERSGGVRDRWGNRWYIASPL